jgi:hypothetical protein
MIYKRANLKIVIIDDFTIKGNLDLVFEQKVLPLLAELQRWPAWRQE